MKVDYRDAEAIAGLKWGNLDDAHFKSVDDWLKSEPSDVSWIIAGVLARVIVSKLKCDNRR